MPPSMRPKRPEPQRPQRPERRQQQVPFEGPDRRRGKPQRPQADRPRGNGQRGGDSVWFTINVGRGKNADPKWLIPLLCRRGNITKRAIGKIQILAKETRVEIAAADADQFAEAVRRPDPKDPRIHIERVDAPI